MTDTVQCSPSDRCKLSAWMVASHPSGPHNHTWTTPQDYTDPLQRPCTGCTVTVSYQREPTVTAWYIWVAHGLRLAHVQINKIHFVYFSVTGRSQIITNCKDSILEGNHSEFLQLTQGPLPVIGFKFLRPTTRNDNSAISCLSPYLQLCTYHQHW